MYKKNFTSVFILICCTSSFAQGELFTREAANQKFGEVLTSVEMEKSIFLNLTNMINNNHLMFRIRDNQVIILDENRNILYPAGAVVDSQDVFTVYNISVINELLSNNSGEFLTIELRKNVLSISFGEMTMEVGMLCPPFCSDD